MLSMLYIDCPLLYCPITDVTEGQLHFNLGTWACKTLQAASSVWKFTVSRRL
jgi:hypothetical protein